MLLSGKEIQRQVDLGNIHIDPFDPKKINPNSYNLSLNNEFAVYKNQVLDMKKDNPIEHFIIPETGFEMKPFGLYLARTNERTSTSKYAPRIDGRSSGARLGVVVHLTAGFGDCGFDGFWTLEMFCLKPLIIYPNVDICQIEYSPIEGELSMYHNDKYNHNTGLQASMMYKDFNEDVVPFSRRDPWMNDARNTRSGIDRYHNDIDNSDDEMSLHPLRNE